MTEPRVVQFGLQSYVLVSKQIGLTLRGRPNWTPLSPISIVYQEQNPTRRPQKGLNSKPQNFMHICLLYVFLLEKSPMHPLKPEISHYQLSLNTMQLKEDKKYNLL